VRIDDGIREKNGKIFSEITESLTTGDMFRYP
jgi:hypothetical protein